MDSVNKKSEEKIDFMQDAIDKVKEQRKMESLVARIDRNFFAEEPIELPHTAKLPELFFENITIRTSGEAFGTVEQAALQLALATGINYRVSQDVQMKPTTRKVQSGSKSQEQEAVGGFPMVRLDFKGLAIDYVKHIAESAGIYWDYKDETLLFSGLLTHTFSLANINPGRFVVQDGINKSGSASTGQTASGGTTNGGFGTSSSILTESNFSFWAEIKEALGACLSPAGRLTISEGVGSVTVTDTKDSVKCVRDRIERENSELAKQVLIEVRSIKLRVNDTTQFGVELNPMYSLRSNENGVDGFKIISAPSTRTESGGQIAAIISTGTNRWSGTTAFVQALKQLGTVVADGTSSIVTTNRVPAMTATYNTYGFLAETKPAQGGTSGGGTPGLTPGSATVGTFLRVLPTIKNNNTIMMNMSVDNSNITGYGSARTGAGESEQQIQWANTDGSKISSNVLLNDGESLVLSSIGEENIVAGSAHGIGGTSNIGERKKFAYIVIVSPRVMKGL